MTAVRANIFYAGDRYWDEAIDAACPECECPVAGAIVPACGVCREELNYTVAEEHVAPEGKVYVVLVMDVDDFRRHVPMGDVLIEVTPVPTCVEQGEALEQLVRLSEDAGGYKEIGE